MRDLVRLVVGIDAGGMRLKLLTVLPRAAVEPVSEEPAMGAARLAAKLAWGAA